MIALWLGLAMANEPGWVSRDLVLVDLDRKSCEATDWDAPELLPEGLAIEVRPDKDCPGFVEIGVRVNAWADDEHTTRWLHARPDSVSKKPVKAEWSKKGGEVRYALGKQVSGDRIVGISAPRADQLTDRSVALGVGERLEVAWAGAIYEDPPMADSRSQSGFGGLHVVRTSAGTPLLVFGSKLRDGDPLDADGRVRVSQLEAGRARFGAAQLPFWGIDGQPEDGVVARFRVAPGGLREADHGEYLDPIGHVYRVECKGDPAKRSRFEATCGEVYLDYEAFGAWWPDRRTEVLVVADGKTRGLRRLRVLVIEPFSDWPRVSPGWDGRKIEAGGPR